MALRNGEPYIPPVPICPIGRDGNEFTIKPEMFDMLAAQGIRDNPAGEQVEDITGMFWPDHDDEAFVGTGLVQVREDSRLGRIADTIKNHPERRQIHYRAGEILCARVVMCRGLTADGDCWALGDDAMVEVVEQVAEEFDIKNE